MTLKPEVVYQHINTVFGLDPDLIVYSIVVDQGVFKQSPYAGPMTAESLSSAVRRFNAVVAAWEARLSDDAHYEIERRFSPPEELAVAYIRGVRVSLIADDIAVIYSNDGSNDDGITLAVNCLPSPESLDQFTRVGLFVRLANEVGALDEFGPSSTDEGWRDYMNEWLIRARRFLPFWHAVILEREVEQSAKLDKQASQLGRYVRRLRAMEKKLIELHRQIHNETGIEKAELDKALAYLLRLTQDDSA